jgi:2,4-dienoyl-CoA reductase-like NADH-dependent reductase (Old Yellow Enzyme family)/thioredoxin reductase
MVTNLAQKDGAITERMIEFFATRARGGVGMCIAEYTVVSEEGKRMPNNVGIWDDRFIEGLSRLASAIRETGAVAGIQIGHGGRESNSSYSGYKPVAPTDLASIYRGTTSEIEKPLVLDVAGIKRLITAFVQAARRASEAGFQAVELHACHGYLISQFLSMCTNKRTDDYGGCLENRARFLIDIIRGIRETCGHNLLVVARINGNDYVDDGNTEKEAAEIAVLAQNAGADAIHVSAGLHQSRPYRIIPGMDLPEACLTYGAEFVKKTVDIPVIAVGNIDTPELAEEILTQKRADLIAMGRALVCDPMLPKKAREGSPEKIRRCICCSQGCLGRVHHLKTISCLQYPVAGRETELTFTPVSKAKDVLVIGGGPAGLAFATVSAKIGHRVTLVEKEDEVGGQLRLAHLPPTRARIRMEIENLTREAIESGVKIITGRQADLQMIEEMRPDRIILAVGSRPNIINIEGLDEVNLVFPEQALLRPESLGQRVVIIGGGLVGAEVADFISDRGHLVTILEMLPDIAADAVTSHRVYLTDHLVQQGVQVICSSKVVGVAPGKVKYIRDGWEFALEGIDNIVMATGVISEKNLSKDIIQSGYSFESVGDCFAPGDGLSAIYQGYLSALGMPYQNLE